MADHPHSSTNSLPASDRPLKDSADGVCFATVTWLLTLGHQNQRPKVQGGDPAVSDAAAAAAASYQEVPVPSPPLFPQLAVRLAPDVHPQTKDQEIQEWTTTATSEQWDALYTKLSTHWSHLPQKLPKQANAQAHEFVYRAIAPRTQELAKFFYIQNLRLVAALALGEKARRVATDNGNGNDDKNDNNKNNAEPTTIYQQLAAQMEESPKLMALCARAATMQATAAESEQLYSYLPEPELSDPSCGAHVRDLRASRKVREKEAATVAYLATKEAEGAEPEPWTLVPAEEESEEDEMLEGPFELIKFKANDGADSGMDGLSKGWVRLDR